MLGEKHVVFRVEAIRLGMFVGSFSGIYHLLCLYFSYVRSKRENTTFKPNKNYKHTQGVDRRSKIETYIAGVVAAGVSVSFLSHDNRRTLALYSMARAFQSLFYSAEQRGIWKSTLPIIPLPFGLSLDVHDILKKHLDSIVFAVSSAQIMFSYVMRPQTLPSSYWNFIVRTGPIPAKILAAARHAANGDYPIPLEKLGLNEQQLDPRAPIVPCSVLHPSNDSCVMFSVNVLESTVQKSWLMYLSLNAFSYIILGFGRFMRNPINCTFRGLLSSARSTFFLAVFVAAYQAVICCQRKVVSKDHKSIYWFAGLISSAAIFIEKKARREELGLYVFPRAIDSIWLAADIKALPKAETFIYALSMGVLVYFYEYSPSCLASMIQSVFKNVLPPKQPEPSQEISNDEISI